MSVTHGMDVAEVRRLGAIFQQRSAEIEGMVRAIDRMVASTDWSGPEANRFKSQWWPGHKAHLVKVSQELSGLGQSAIGNAQAQEEVSGAGVSDPGVSDPGRSTSQGSSSGGFFDWVIERNVVNRLETIVSVAGLVTLVAAAFLLAPKVAVAAGVAGVAVKVALPLTLKLGKSLSATSKVLDVADFGLKVHQYGWGSSEVAETAFSGGLKSGVSLVPGGSEALEIGKSIGGFLYQHTPLGDHLESSVVGGFETDLASFSTRTDQALASGNFAEAQKLTQLAQIKQEEMSRATTGWTGLGNSVMAVVNPFN